MVELRACCVVSFNYLSDVCWGLIIRVFVRFGLPGLMWQCFQDACGSSVLRSRRRITTGYTVFCSLSGIVRAIEHFAVSQKTKVAGFCDHLRKCE
jgi:hypothetical protein